MDVANPELVPGIRWRDLCDDMNHLAIASLDLRGSWDEPEDPWVVAAWVKWTAMAAWERDKGELRANLQAQTPQPARADGPRPNLDAVLAPV